MAFRTLLLALFLTFSVSAITATAQEPATEELELSGGDEFDFFSDEPIAEEALIELPQPKSKWISIGAPIGLVLFFFLMVGFFWWVVPFHDDGVALELREYPVGVRRGLAMALCFFGIAFVFGILEVHYQLSLHETVEAYFGSMSLGKLIAFTHAHLFGFTTSFLIIGIPFSMQFSHLWQYQWLFPFGLAASLTDVASWWGIKYLSPNFEHVTFFCGFIFSISYLIMLIGLLRILWFPEVTWRTDKDFRQRIEARKRIEREAIHKEGDY